MGFKPLHTSKFIGLILVCGLLFANHVHAASYVYTFESGIKAIIGTGSADYESRTYETETSYITKTVNPGLKSVEINKDLQSKLGSPKVFQVHDAPVESVIIFHDHQRMNLNRGESVNVPVRVVGKQRNQLFETKEALVLINREVTFIQITVLTSEGIAFKAKLPVTDFQLLDSLRPSQLIEDIYLTGGDPGYERSVLTLSVKSRLGDRTIIASTNLARSGLSLTNSPNEAGFIEHYSTPGFYEYLRYGTYSPANENLELNTELVRLYSATHEITTPADIIPIPTGSKTRLTKESTAPLETLVGKSTVEFELSYSAAAEKVKLARKTYEQKIVGSDSVADKLFQQTEAALRGDYERPLRQKTGTLPDGNRTGPRIRMLLAGPGDGRKIDRAIAYAEAFGLPYFHVSQFSFVHYSPSEVIQNIAAVLNKNPRTVLIFENFDRFNSTFLEMLLGLLKSDESHLNLEGKRHVISSRFATVFVTTQLAESELESKLAVIRYTNSRVGFQAITEPTYAQAFDTSPITSSDYVQLMSRAVNARLKSNFGSKFLSEFKPNISLVRVPLPDQDTIRKALLLMASKEIPELNKKYEDRLDIRSASVGRLAREIANLASQEKMDIRKASSVMKKQLERYFAAQVRNGPRKITTPWWAVGHRPQVNGMCEVLFKY